MNPIATNNKASPSSPSLNQIIRKSLIIYLLSAVIVPAVCFIFGWRAIDNVGAGFIYGSIALVVFGALFLAGNTIPAQLSRLSLPKYDSPSLKHHPESESDGFKSKGWGTGFFLSTLICGVFLFLTGLILKSF